MSEVDDDLRDLYQDLILDHGKRPRNFRVLPEASAEGVGHNPLCGDRLVLYLTLRDGRITDAAFQGSGCAISMASASMMTEMLKGRTVAETESLFGYFHGLCTGAAADGADVSEDDRERLQALGGVRHFPVRVKCATLAWHTLQAALGKGETVSTE